MQRFHQHAVFVVSGGRTGTKYFGDLLGTLIEHAFSVHEPDVWGGLRYHPISRLREFGIYHLLIGKLLGRTGIRNLSQQYLAGRLDLEELTSRIRQHREKYYRRLNAGLVIESYTGWYGVLPALPHTYEHYRIIAILRDPRTWVTSYMNWGTMFGPRDWVTRLGLGRLNPIMLGDEEFSEQWNSMGTFERICWSWKAINSAIIDHVDHDPNARLFRFEELFLSSERASFFQELLEFATRFSDRTFEYHFDKSILDRRIHESADTRFPHWRDWPPEKAATLQHICGTLMQRFGYGAESEWTRLVESARPYAGSKA